MPDLIDLFCHEPLVLSCLIAKDEQITHVADCVFTIDSSYGKQTFQCRYLEKLDRQLERQGIQSWISNNADLLAGHEITLELRDYRRWQLPSSNELHRLGRISVNRVPDVFGPQEIDQAITKFVEGDVQGCMDMFSKMLDDKENAALRNNLPFCQILTGAVSEGLENTTKVVAADYEPLFEMNKGIAEFLLGNRDSARQSLTNALKQLTDPNTKYTPDALYVLVLDPGLDKVNQYEGLPVDAAILINLWRIGASSQSELEIALAKVDAEKAKTWLAQFVEPQHS